MLSCLPDRNHPMPKRFSIIALLTAALCAIAGAAGAGPSFDCELATTKVENMICASQQLGDSDQEMARLYTKSMGGSSAWLTRMQARWLASRNKCGDAACLAASYRERIQQLDAIKMLLWDSDSAYAGVLDIAKDQATLIRGQQAWRKTLDQCSDLACLERNVAQRVALLDRLKESVARAGTKRYLSRALGIGFDYLENRTVLACSEPNCVRLVGQAMGEGSEAILEISVVDGSLDAVAGSMWERNGKEWHAQGRGGSEGEVEQYTGSWEGLHATVMCGFSDRNGFHAEGECNTYLRSNGKRTVIIRDDGASGKDDASATTISTIHFLR